jgi:hypothetical protein
MSIENSTVHGTHFRLACTVVANKTLAGRFTICSSNRLCNNGLHQIVEGSKECFTFLFEHAGGKTKRKMRRIWWDLSSPWSREDRFRTLAGKTTGITCSRATKKVSKPTRSATKSASEVRSAEPVLLTITCYNDTTMRMLVGLLFSITL